MVFPAQKAGQAIPPIEKLVLKSLTARSPRVFAVAAVLAAAALGLVGCGSSSPPRSSQSSAAAKNTVANAIANADKKLGISPQVEAAAARVGVRTLTSCLREHGVKVPPQPPLGAHPSFSLKGVNSNSAQFRSCLSKATAVFKSLLHKGRGVGSAKISRPKVSAQVKGAAARVGVIVLTKCMTENGVKVPPQRLSVPHPVFNVHGLNAKSPEVAAAFRTCLPKAIAAHNARLRQG